MNAAQWLAWLNRHKWRIVGAGSGVILAVLFLTIGFWRALLVLLLGLIGFVVGLFLDSESEFRSLLGKLIPKGKDD